MSDTFYPADANSQASAQTSNQASSLPGTDADIGVRAEAAAVRPSPDLRDVRKLGYERNKCHKKLRRLVGQALTDFNMLTDGDKVMVCLSGGKDSYAMLDILLSFQRHAPINFEVVAVNLDQKQPGFPEHILPQYLDEIGVPYEILEEDTYSVVKKLTPEGKTTCPVCSRLRRGILYAHAKRIGATKIALGHHMDDVVETLFLNMFYGGRMKAMPAKLRSDDGQNMLIRPLFYCREQLIEQWAEIAQYPIIPCNLCGSQENLQRQTIKQMLLEWDKLQPGRVENIARSLGHISPSQMADHNLFDFVGLNTGNILSAVPDLADVGLANEGQKGSDGLGSTTTNKIEVRSLD